MDAAAEGIDGARCCTSLACTSASDIGWSCLDERTDEESVAAGAGCFEVAVKAAGGTSAARCCAKRIGRV